MNTKICYKYRDAANWKTFYEEVVDGIISAEEQEQIWDSLDCEEWFVPSQVGLPAMIPEPFDPQYDHFLCELDDFCEVSELPTVNMTAKEIVEKFLAAKGHWETPFS